MAESKVSRVVKKWYHNQPAGTYLISVDAPKGYRLVSQTWEVADDQPTSMVQAITDYGLYYQDTNGDGVLDRAVRKIVQSASAEITFTTIFERSSEPDVFIEENH